MKKIIEKIGIETFLGGVFGVAAIIAIIAEMCIAGFDPASVAGGIKDISGTIITVIMLAVAISALRPRKKETGEFMPVFKDEMEKIMDKYMPLVSFYGEEESKNYQGYIRYHIANKTACVSTNNPGGNNKFFRIKEGINEIEFSVSTTVFGSRHEEVKAIIAAKIQSLYGNFVSSYKITPAGFVLTFSRPFSDGNDAVELAGIIDHMLILYIAEDKK